MNAKSVRNGSKRTRVRCLRSFGHSLKLSAFVDRIIQVSGFIGVIYGAQAQTIAPLPNAVLAAGGEVDAAAVQDDGKVVIGGSFTMVDGIPRNHIARLNSDGSLDASWQPALPASDYGWVSALAVGSTNVYVSQVSDSGFGPLEATISKFNTEDTGAADGSWNVSADGVVNAMVVSGTNLFVGGAFTSVGGVNRGALAKLNASGSGAVAAGWNPNPSGFVSALTVNGTSLYVGGGFSSIGGQFRNNLAKLSVNGAGSADAIWSPNPDGYVYRIGINGSDVFVSGVFASVGGQARNSLAKLTLSGTGDADALWDPSPTAENSPNIHCLTVIGNSIYVGGSFTGIGGLAQTNIAKLSASGTGIGDSAWRPAITGGYQDLADIAPIGTDLLCVGDFTKANGNISLGIARLNGTDGARVPGTAHAQLKSPNVQAIALQEGGKVVVGGNFVMVGRTPRGSLARFNQDGTLDADWNPDVDGTVEALAIGTSDIYIGGLFNTVGGQARTNIAKVSANATGQVDLNWSPSANEEVKALLVAGTNVIVSGSFTNIGGLSRRFIAKLGAGGAGGADPVWNPSASSTVSALGVFGTNVFVGGSFTNIGGLSRYYIAKISLDGSGAADSVWNPYSGGYVDSFYYGYGVQSIVVSDSTVFIAGGDLISHPYSSSHYKAAKLSATGNGQADFSWDPKAATGSWPYSLDCYIAANESDVYLGGSFDNAGNLPRLNLTKANATGNGVVDPNWQADANGTVRALALTGTNLYVGGYFTTIGGVARSGFALITTPPSPPSISIQPAQYQAVLENDYAYFSVQAAGSGTLNYQWRKDQIQIADATNNSYLISNVSTNDAGIYSVIVSNAYGMATSSNAVLDVIAVPSLEHALDTVSLDWITGGFAPWHGQVFFSHDGVDAAVSGYIPDLKESWLQTTVTGPGVIAFWWKVSSETNYDFLEFDIGGVLQNRISGEVGWQQRSFDVASGLQTLRWRYSKDKDTSGGHDLGWVDQVSFTVTSLRLNAALSGSNFILEFPTIASKTYRVEFRDNLSTGLWQPLTGYESLAGTGAPQTVTFPVSAATQRFYRTTLAP